MLENIKEKYLNQYKEFPCIIIETNNLIKEQEEIVKQHQDKLAKLKQKADYLQGQFWKLEHVCWDLI